MKLAGLLLLLALINCQSKKTETTVESSEYETTESIEELPYAEPVEEFILPDKKDWNYQRLYGYYQHESNASGFSAAIEIRPEGNDLSFILSVKQNACSGSADGIVGIAIFSEEEYTGFYDNADCRLEFTFSPNQQTIRIREVGVCMLRERGCSFDGVYIRKN